MKVAIAICIIFIVINFVNNDDSVNNDASLDREKRDASPAERKGSKLSRKEQKKRRKRKRKKDVKDRKIKTKNEKPRSNIFNNIETTTIV